MQETNRRTFLLASGSTAASLALAGCGQFYNEGRDPDNLYAGGEESDGGSEDGGSEPAPEGVPQEVHDYLSGDVGNYDGSVEDMTGEGSVTVQNGEIEGVEQQFAFEPAAIRIDAGTEVTWEWAGGSSHSVTHEGGNFDSGIQSGDGSTFSHTFDEAGVYPYFCIPHKALGQKGAVVVE